MRGLCHNARADWTKLTYYIMDPNSQGTQKVPEYLAEDDYELKHGLESVYAPVEVLANCIIVGIELYGRAIHQPPQVTCYVLLNKSAVYT